MPKARAPFALTAGPNRQRRDRPLRILYVINDLTLGGAQRVLVDQALALEPLRYHPEVASLEIVPGGVLARELEAAGVTVHRLRGPSEPPIACWPRLQRLLHARRPALVHTHLAAAGVAARLVAPPRLRPRLLCTVHNLSDWEEGAAHPLRWLDRRTMSRCDRIIAISEAVRRAVVGLLPELSDRAITVYNGVRLEALSDAQSGRSRVRAALGYKVDDFVVGSVARLDYRKGLDTLLRAAARARVDCPTLRLLLVGDGPERGSLGELARGLGLEDRVRFAGAQTDIRSFLVAMDLFAAPSRTEGLGVAIIEALAAGVPAFGSRVGGIPEIIQDGRCGRLLPPHHPDLWAQAIAHCVANPAELRVLAGRAVERAASFSLRRSAERLQAIYADVVSEATELEEAA